MTRDTGALDRRLAAVERAITDGDAAVADLPDAADLADRVAAVEDRLADLEARADELDAATQALRGYVGGVRAVNREVERRADLALAAAEATREAVEGDPAAGLDLPDDLPEPGETGVADTGNEREQAAAATEGESGDELADRLRDLW